MGVTVRKVVKTIHDIEAELTLRDIDKSTFLESIPVAAVTWSKWKNKALSPSDWKWAKVLDAHERLKNAAK